MATITAEKLETAAKDVKLDQMYEDFFKSPGKSAVFDKHCNVFDKGDKQNEEAKKLCSELVYYLEKIRGKSTKEEDSKKYCGYLHYWLYDKIDKIQNSPTTKIDKIKFYEDLINAGKEIKGTNLKSTCPLSKLKDVDLNELKYRKLSYIYFQNLEKIKQIITSKDKDNCTKYLTYLESFKSLHERYNNAECRGLMFWTPQGTDYFPCKDRYSLSSFISNLAKCKTGDTSDPKALPAKAAKDKVAEGQAALGGQKASEGATVPKASVGAAGQKASVVTTSSSSSSTTVSTSTAGGTTKTTTVSSSVSTTTTTTASSAVTTTPKATVTTAEAGTKPVTTVTQAKTTSATTTTNTVITTSTRSSSSQGGSIFSFFLGGGGSRTSQQASSSGASQISSSPSRTLGSRTSGSLVSTTSTPYSKGSISSTGQGGLARPLAAGAEHGKSLSPPLQGSSGYALNLVSLNNSNTGGDTNLATVADVPGSSETLYDKLDSNTVKNIVMAAAVLGIIFFLFYYNRSSRIESSIKPKKRKKKAFEHNYYEEYEKELAKYESDNESLDSLDDRYYLTYQPEGDSHY
ncbi:PIR protein [Plasmodium vivax]|uniref:VIR protein n=1 Tax=Plasmodium vivax TaxID=5855 RepID=A0A565A5C0_PLAVI|nr:PIR protein [Plasmodium vivax]